MTEWRSIINTSAPKLANIAASRPQPAVASIILSPALGLQARIKPCFFLLIFSYSKIRYLIQPK